MSPPPPLDEPLSGQNPWPGLRFFTETDKDYFRGRTREAENLVELVVHSTVTVFYGRPGLGKTSLLLASVFPLLTERGFLPMRLRLKFEPQDPSLVQQIKDLIAETLQQAGLAAPRPQADETLWEYFHRRDTDFWGPRNRLLTPVIALDQFEEVFTQRHEHKLTAERVAELATELEALVENRMPGFVQKKLDAEPERVAALDLQRPPVKLILSLRDDYLGALDAWRKRMPALLKNRLKLEPMSGTQALEVVNLGEHLMDPGIANSTVEFVSASQDAATGDIPLTERRIEPALLCVFCAELNRLRREPAGQERGQPLITLELLNQQKKNIVNNFYQRAFAGLPAESRERIQEWIEDNLLVSKLRVRQPAALDEYLRAELPIEAIDHLDHLHVVNREKRQGLVWLELSHDILVEPAALSRDAREERLRTRKALEEAAEARRRSEEASAQLKNEKLAREHYESLHRKLRFRYRLGVGLLLVALGSLFALLGVYLSDQKTQRRNLELQNDITKKEQSLSANNLLAQQAAAASASFEATVMDRFMVALENNKQYELEAKLAKEIYAVQKQSANVRTSPQQKIHLIYIIFVQWHLSLLPEAYISSFDTMLLRDEAMNTIRNLIDDPKAGPADQSALRQLLDKYGKQFEKLSQPDARLLYQKSAELSESMANKPQFSDQWLWLLYTDYLRLEEFQGGPQYKEEALQYGKLAAQVGERILAKKDLLPYYQTRILGKQKKWGKAVEAAQEWVDLLKGLPTLDEDSKKKLLSGAYLSLSWYQLFATNFAEALSATTEGLKFKDDSLSLQTNRAHALLFLGETEKADKIYFGNIGKTFPDGSGRIWDDVILKDFRELEEAKTLDPKSEQQIQRVREELKRKAAAEAKPAPAEPTPPAPSA